MATPERIVDHNGLSREQINLIQEFEADFNAVDHFLRVALASEDYVGFTKLVRRYSSEHVGWADAEFLTTIAKIRNLIVHERTDLHRHVVIPTLAVAKGLKHCKERLMNPARAVPTFQRPVETISIHATLSRVLKIINERDYSQFPVYDDKRFRGLLTFLARVHRAFQDPAIEPSTFNPFAHRFAVILGSLGNARRNSRSYRQVLGRNIRDSV